MNFFFLSKEKIYSLLDGPHYSRVNEGLRINRVEMHDNDTFWCRADVLETGESSDFPITVIISSKKKSVPLLLLSLSYLH